MTTPITSLPMMRVTPSTSASPTAATSGGGKDFGSIMQSAVDAGHEAEAQSVKAITEGGNVTEVSTAIAHAQMTLQTATAVRDRVLSAYQDIMRIQI